MATNFQLKPFTFNIADLNFMRDQVNFSPLFDVAGNAIIAWNGVGAVYNDKHVLYADMGSAAANITAYGTSYDSATAAQGLRDVTGLNNNLFLANATWGSVDQPFMQRVQANFEGYVKAHVAGDAGSFYANKSFTLSVSQQAILATQLVNGPDYLKTATHAGHSVVDYTPRMISQLITTGGATPLQASNVDGGQVLHWNAVRYTTDTAYAAAVDTVSVGGAGLIEGAAIMANIGLLAGGQHDPQDPTNSEMFFGAINPGVAPSNSFLAYFGQFFDHGLDFIGKGADGTKITIPLAIDDPLYRAPGTNGPSDPGNTKITVSRADVSGFDANGNAQWINHTSPYIDQSQTYGSHAQITALLREWVSTDGGATFHAGAHLFDGATSASWTNAWGETTTATLPTLKELNAHLIATGRDPLTWDDVSDLRVRDANGDVIDNDLMTAGIQATGSGQALLLDMNPHFDTSHFSAATITALASAGITADVHGNYALGGPPGGNHLGNIIDFRTFTPLNDLAKQVLFDSVSDHYIAGDGRANENIALTTIHHVFHEEHNYQVRNIEEAIQAQDARAVVLGDSSHSIAHDWQTATNFQDANGNYLLSAGGAIAWNESKLFDAAKLTVEMEYQHAAVDQYARTITPDLPEFVGYNSGENATVSLEYAQGAFRFGHSTMRETIDMMDPNGSITGKVMSVALEQAFLNPALFAQKGAAAIAMGMTHQQMNEIDELLTPAMNQGLLGQPLDLAAINIARGRDLGLPTLNEFRGAIGLSKYTGWSDFGNHMVHPESLANFIAAYSFDGDVAKAQAIVGLEGGSIVEGSVEAMGYTLEYAINFLNGADTGFEHIDTWIGGLAEVHVMGGLLGETFNLVFLDQINRLMDGDRFYYLYRLNNLNMGDEIANAQLKDIVERNTGLEHLNGSVFAYADQYIDLSAKVDTVHNADTGDFKVDHKYGQLLEDRAALGQAAIGIYSKIGTSTNSNGTITMVNGVQYIRDIRAEGANNNPNVNGTNLDGSPDTGANSNEVLIGSDNNDLLYMAGGDDTAYGERGNDIIYGDAGIDRLYGGDGNDTIYGGDSGDLIDGGAGDDLLFGDSSGSAAAGVDQIIGGAGNDTIYGGVGIDKLSGGTGDDVIFGGGDTDAFTHGGDGNDYLDGQSDGDILWGDGGSDLIVGGNNQDIVAGLDGDDILRPGNPSSAMGGGPDEVMGGDGASDLGFDGKGIGFDLIDFSDYTVATTGVTIDFATQTNPVVAIDGTTPFPAWIGIEGAIGSRNNDTFIADDTADVSNNWMIGGSGNDNFTGGAGNDVIVGDGIRLDSLIGTYSSGYNGTFDGASHRATGFIGSNGLLDAAGMAGEKHFTEMLKTELFKDLVLGGSTIQTLNGVADTRMGDGGTAGSSDMVMFTGNFADYTVTTFSFATAGEGAITAFKIQDNRDGSPGGTDVVVGVEQFNFNGVVLTAAQVAAVQHAPVITSNNGDPLALSLAEHIANVTTVTATDADVNDTLAYSVTGTHAALFKIDANGVLAFKTAPNFVFAGNNVYNVNVVVTDLGGLSDTQAIQVTLTDVNDFTPIITSNGGNATATLAINENTAAVTTVMATDADLPAQTLTYSISGGADRSLFIINSSTGVLSFVNAPNFENKLDAGADNVYDVVVQVSDDGGLIDTQAIAVTVNNVNEAATGALRITGYTSNANGTSVSLTASNTIVDADGMTGVVTYQWERFVNNAWTAIGGANSAVLAGQVNTTVRVKASYTDSVFGGNYEFTSNETAYITGSGGNNTLNGSAGNDYVLGLAGNDILTGGAGNDTVDGGSGNDTLRATLNDGNDVYIGGAGVDTYDLTAVNTGVTVNFNLGTSTGASTGSDTITGVEYVTSGAGNDTVVMAVDNIRNHFNGGAGSDTVDYSAYSNNLTIALNGAGTRSVGGSGAVLDTVQSVENFTGGSGNDTITGDNLANRLNGGLGNDTISGAAGADILNGGAGNDLIVGGTGADNLTGGANADTFDYNAINESGIGAAARDVITDFVSGTDRIDLSTIDASVGGFINLGNQAFTFNALAGASITGIGQLVYHYENIGAANEITVIEGNINNDLGVDFQIALLGHVNLLAGDFIL